MSDNSKIEWTDATWNPVTGCTKVSPGCDHCYAERVTERFHGPGSFATIQLHPARLDQPLRWRKPRMVFVNSMSDLFHDDVPTGFIAEVFAVMHYAPQHTFQLLTKRHGRMRALLGSDEFFQLVWDIAENMDVDGHLCKGFPPDNWPLPNVWLGVSVEDQKWADIRVPALLETPAAVRWLSCEPLLGPVELMTSRCPSHDFPGGFCTFSCAERRKLDWVVAGGESGPGARPMHPDWARGLRDQCVQAGVPFFFKQWGSWAPGDPNGWYSRSQWVDATENGPSEFMYAPKSKSLRELDGRTWDEYPAGAR